MNEIQLLATDLDGTLVSSRDEYALYTQLRLKMNELRSLYDTTWVISTGRSIKSFHSVYLPLKSAGIMPDYVIVQHAFTYSVKPWGYWPHFWWNQRMKMLIYRDMRLSRKLIKHCLQMLRSRFRRVKVLSIDRDRLCVRFPDNDVLDAAADLVHSISARYKNLQVFKQLSHLDIRTIPATKGMAVAELASHLGIPRENTLAIGDGYNDVSMLDGALIGLTGCPGNASPRVMSHVNRTGGHVAEKTYLSGSLEVLDAYTTDRVNSELPDSWEEASQREANQSPSSQRESTTAKALKGAAATSCMIGAVGLILLLVLANFGLLGAGPSRLIMMPLEKIMQLIAGLLC